MIKTNHVSFTESTQASCKFTLKMFLLDLGPGFDLTTFFAHATARPLLQLIVHTLIVKGTCTNNAQVAQDCKKVKSFMQFYA